MPVISVIVPVYNVEPYIHRCIDSILAQTFTDFELILVDDGSPDNCGAICEEYAVKDRRVHVLHQQNQGQAAARNHALDWVFSNSDSEYISFVDSDDWVHSRFLELLLEGARRYKANICQCGHIETNTTEVEPKVYGTFSCITPEEQYIHHYSAFMWDKLFARACWEKIRFPEGQIYEDLAIWYKMLFREERVSLVEDALYYYFVNRDSTVRKDWTLAKLAQIDAWEEQLAFLRKRGNKSLFEAALVHYFQISINQLQAIENSILISNKAKCRYQRILRRKIAGVFPKVWRFPEVKSMGAWPYDLVFPVSSWLFWTARGVAGKFGRIIRKIVR